MGIFFIKVMKKKQFNTAIKNNKGGMHPAMQ